MIAADHLAVLLDEPLGDVCRSGQRLAEGLLQAQKLYRSDFIIVFADVAVEPEAMGVRLEYFPQRNPQPVIHLKISEVGTIRMSASGRIPELFEAAKLCRASLGDNTPIFFSMKDPFSLAAMTVGTELFLEKLITEPQVAFDLLEICTQNQLELINSIIAGGYVPFIGAPIASGGLIGAGYFKRFASPYLMKLLNTASKAGSYRCLHICGEIGMLTDELLELNLDVLSFEDHHASMWEKLTGTIPMGFVPTEFFLRRNAERLKPAVTECKEVLPEPFILSSGCDLPAQAEPELVQMMMTC
jgi:uroporphyrinogen-III decarboxylase